MKPAEGSTVIGKSVSIRGDLSGKEDLYMDGEIEGTITLPENTLTVGPNARVMADIHARSVIVLGSIHGNLHATGRVELRHSAAVLGDIFATRLSMEENANLKGHVELMTSEASVSSSLQPVPSVATQDSLVLEPNA
ncbi:bactofilin family protein [Edaphobacter bradus]|uniref:bactofilin family protein n=1 Tax=Edaphobacter bradus TaxID=2259016 RepID=UPI0021DF7BC4|nr:polymer-forming cytoskeletal protein [Edaphobacter bradus]